MISLPIWLVVVLGLAGIAGWAWGLEMRAWWKREQDANRVAVRMRQDGWTQATINACSFRGLTEDDLPPDLSLRNRTVTLPKNRNEILDRMTTEAIAGGLYDRHPDYEVQPPEDDDGA